MQHQTHTIYPHIKYLNIIERNYISDVIIYNYMSYQATHITNYKILPRNLIKISARSI